MNTTIWTKRPSQAAILKIASVAIAAPRYIGAFGAAIGFAVLQDPSFGWLKYAESYSGGAMAILEGFALAFVLRKLRTMQKVNVDWWILITMIAMLTATLPLVALPYLLSEQWQVDITSVFGGWQSLQIFWSFLVVAVPMLIIVTVGFADVEEGQKQPAKLQKVSQKAPIASKSDNQLVAKSNAKGRKTQREKMQQRAARARQLHAEGVAIADIGNEIGVKDMRTVKRYLRIENSNGVQS